MKIDKDKLSAIASLDDKTFADIVYRSVLSAGGNQAQAKAAMAASPIIKSRLKNASDSDVSRLVSFLGEKNTIDVLNKYGK